MRRKIIELMAAAVLLVLLTAGVCCPCKAMAQEEGKGTLVIEVAEEISVDQLDELENGEVPLGAYPEKAKNPLPVLIAVSVAAAGFSIWYLYRDRERNRLLKQRKEGYRTEEERLEAGKKKSDLNP